MTEKQKYEKPSMEVFKLQQQTQLLAGSTASSGDIPGSDSYTPDTDPFTF